MIDLPQGFATAATVISAIALNALWQDALLVVSIWVLLRLWPRVNAATRYVVWSATLVAAFILPVATTLSFFAAPRSVPTAVAATQISPPRVTVTPAAQPHNQPAYVRERRASAPVPVLRAPERLSVTIPPVVAVAVFAAWLLLALYALIRLTIGLVRLEQLKRDALPLPVEYRDAMPHWTRANKGTRDVRLCVSDDTDVPVAVGLFDAMILVPHTLLDRLSEGEVDQICLHELAHLRRADDWTNGMQRLLIALLGWNPAAQFIGQQLDLEREVACDDWVLSFVRMVRPYALCLTKMAERASWPRHPIPAPGVFATRRHISLRIERLLGAGRNIATNLSPAPAAAALAAVAALTLVIAVVAPSVAAPYVAQTIAVTRAPKVAVRSAHEATAAAKETTRTIVREVRVAVASTPATEQTSAAHPAARSITVPSVTVPGVKVPAVHVPAITVPGVTVSGVTVPEVVVPKITVPGYDSKQLAQTISKQVRENVNAALGRPAATGSARNCSGCDFGGVNWAGRDMRGVNYTGVDLSRANLNGTNFSGGSFNGVDFTRANLANASFRNARLTGCDFSEANLAGVDFRGARLSGCQFTGAQLASSELRDVLDSCTGCDFRRSSLSGLDLSNVRANGDDFSGADLRGVNFSGAQLTGVDFTGARLDGANLTGTTFNGCDLSHVDLSRVDLSRTKMIGTDFSNRRSSPPKL